MKNTIMSKQTHETNDGRMQASSSFMVIEIYEYTIDTEIYEWPSVHIYLD